MRSHGASVLSEVPRLRQDDDADADAALGRRLVQADQGLRVVAEAPRDWRPHLQKTHLVKLPAELAFLDGPPELAALVAHDGDDAADELELAARIPPSPLFRR